MRALSIRQPWAWCILNGKPIENRDWPTNFRGRFLIHAAKGMTEDEYEDTAWFAATLGLNVPAKADLQRGGIIGSAEMVDCVTHSTSPWFFGEYGFVLRDPRPMPFVPFKGSLGFFMVPDFLIPAGHAV